MAQTFKTASLAGYGALGDNADVLRGFMAQSPELLAQIGGQSALDQYIAQHQQALGWNSETNGDFQWNPQTQAIDQILSGYNMNSVGAAGLEDGRQKAIVKDGQTLYTGDPYSYQPAKENLQTALTGLALIGGTAGLQGLLGNIGAGAAGGAGELAGWDAAMADLAAAAPMTPEAFAAGGAAAGTAGEIGSIAGTSADKAALFGEAGYGSGMSGSATSAYDSILGLTGSKPIANLAGTVVNGGSALSNLLGSTGSGGGSSAASGLLGWLKANPKLGGALLGGLLGGSGGGSSGGGYSYNGPMPTISRGGWKPQAQAQLMQPQNVAPMLNLNQQGQQNSGLLRYLNGGGG
jgi:hypothetical protein